MAAYFLKLRLLLGYLSLVRRLGIVLANNLRKLHVNLKFGLNYIADIAYVASSLV